MSLRERIQSDLTASMRSGDSLRRDVLRMAESALYNAEKAKRQPLGEDEVQALVAREVKTRRESVEAFRKGGREELATREEAEIAILQGYLPAQLGDDELQRLVDEAIAATGASSPRDMGKVMGRLAPATRGRADGRRLSEMVAATLARRDLAAHDTAGH